MAAAAMAARPIDPALCASVNIFFRSYLISRPAHHDKTAMNGAQLLKSHGDFSGLMSGPPAAANRSRIVCLSQHFLPFLAES
jgi:hypothetical protein